MAKPIPIPQRNSDSEPAWLSPQLAEIDGYGHETRDLRGNYLAFKRPWRKHPRWWVRWPTQTWHIILRAPLSRRSSFQYRTPPSLWSAWIRQFYLRYQHTLRYLKSLGGLRPLFRTRLSFLLILTPLALIANRLDFSSGLRFALSFFAITGLSGLIYTTIDDISASVPLTIGRLFIALTDTLVELVVSFWLV